MIAGAIPGWDDRLRSVDSTGDATCDFEKKSISGWVAWTHSSGFSIRVSEARLHEDRYVHHTLATIEVDAVSLLEDYPDLWAFLEHCSPGGQLFQADAASAGFDVASVGGLVPFGYYAQFLRAIQGMSDIPRGTFRLQDAPNFETAITLDVLRQLATDGHLQQPFCFFAGAAAFDAERSMRCRVPICMNTPRHGMIAWMNGVGRVYYRDGNPCGLSLDTVDSVAIELRKERFAKGQWPEVPISPNDPRTIVLSADPSESSAPSDPSTWNCGIIVKFQSELPRFERAPNDST